MKLNPEALRLKSPTPASIAVLVPSDQASLVENVIPNHSRGLRKAINCRFRSRAASRSLLCANGGVVLRSDLCGGGIRYLVSWEWRLEGGLGSALLFWGVGVRFGRGGFGYGGRGNIDIWVIRIMVSGRETLILPRFRLVIRRHSALHEAT